MDFLLCLKWNPEIDSGDIINIIVFIFAIIQFNKQMKANRNTNSETQKYNWYLNIIVLPQLSNIQSTYDELSDTIYKEIDHLKNIGSNAENPKHIVESKEICKELINSKLYDTIVPLVRSYNNKLGNSVSNIIMELEDICTTNLDQYNSKAAISIKAQVLRNKELLITTLNKGIRLKE